MVHHALIGLRALGEAVFWGTIGGGVYGLLLAVVSGAGFEGIWLSIMAATIGLAAGMVTGLVGAVVAGLLSLTKVGDLQSRVIAGVVSGACVAGFCWLLFHGDDEIFGRWLETPREWLTLVVGPGVAAVAVGAWRGPVVLRSRTPTLARNASRLEQL